MRKQLNCTPYGDSAVLVKFASKIDPKVNAMVHALSALILKEKPEWIVETIPAYSSLTVIYDPKVIDFITVIDKLNELEKKCKSQLIFSSLIEVPTVYGGEYGPDLRFVAKYNRLSVEEVVKIHSSTEYLVYMLGFTPGFAYLGGMSKKIATPRLEKPRKKVPAGSVGIGGKQTGIYPFESPGGWRIIGRTPLVLFDVEKDPPVLLKSGDRVKFISISEDEYKRRERSKWHD